MLVERDYVYLLMTSQWQIEIYYLIKQTSESNCQLDCIWALRHSLAPTAHGFDGESLLSIFLNLLYRPEIYISIQFPYGSHGQIL